MSGSFDKTAALILAVRTADGTAQQLTSEFKEAVNTAVQNVQPEIQKLGAYLCKAFDVAQPIAQAEKAFSNLLKEASRGRFMEDHIQQVMRLRDTFNQVGDAQRKFLAEGLLTVHGASAGRPGYNPQQAANQFASWQMTNTMGGQPNPEYDRMKIEEAIFKGFQRAGEAARVQSHADASRIRAEQDAVDLARRTAAANATMRSAYRHADDEIASDALIQRQRSERFADPSDILRSRVGDRSLYQADRIAYRRIQRIIGTTASDQAVMEHEYTSQQASDRMIAGMSAFANEQLPDNRLSRDQIYGNQRMRQGLEESARQANAEKRQRVENAAVGIYDYGLRKNERDAIAKRSRVADAEQFYNAAQYDRDIMRRHAGNKKADRIWEAYRNDPLNPDGIEARRARNQQDETDADRFQNRFQHNRQIAGDAQRERIDAHASRYGAEVARTDAYWQRRRDKVEHAADQYTRVQGRYGRLIDQRNVILDQYMEGYQQQVNPRGKKPFHAGHNFRFAAQNLGFGIDDAIQSYHYGGVAASIRAASNNVTAIAGMTIPNPAVAAGAVVALSVASAVLPSILKRYGIDEELTKAAAVRFSGTGGSAGKALRGTSSPEDVNSKIDELFGIRDQFQHDQDSLEVAKKNVRKYWKRDPNKVPVGYSMMLTGAAKSEFDAALEYVQHEGSRNLQNNAKYSQTNRELDRLLGTDFQMQEGRRRLGTAGDRALYRADSLDSYNDTLRNNYDNRVANINATVKNKGDRDLQLKAEEYRYKDQLSRTEENNLAVIQNRTARHRAQEDFISGVYTATNQVSAANLKYTRAREDTVNDISLGNADRDSRLAAIAKGQGRYTDYALQDERRSILGYNSQISDLTVGFNRRQDQYTSDPDLSLAQRHILLRDNAKGFALQRANMFRDMANEHTVNNPIGTIQGNFAVMATQLQSQIAAGGMSEVESTLLTNNLKTDYAYQIKQASIPSGTERFISNAADIGSSEDRELQQRMLGVYGKKAGESDLAEVMGKSLEELIKMLTELQGINSKLEIVRSQL